MVKLLRALTLHEIAKELEESQIMASLALGLFSQEREKCHVNSAATVGGVREAEAARSVAKHAFSIDRRYTKIVSIVEDDMTNLERRKRKR